jgi:hypothetical protein
MPCSNWPGSSCEASYGIHGWLGISPTIWIYRQSHRAGNSKVNNTYFNQAFYNTIPWRQLVICQEIGHNFGSGHVNVVFGNRNVRDRAWTTPNDPDGLAVSTVPATCIRTRTTYALINCEAQSHRVRYPGQLLRVMEARGGSGSERDGDAARDGGLQPVVLSQFGTLKREGRRRPHRRCTRFQFASGWKAVNFVTGRTPPTVDNLWLH